MKAGVGNTLESLNAALVGCRSCPRLVDWREDAARKKTARFSRDAYWARPVPGFGDPRARLLVVGLAPAAHGANRTGRMFTGDRSGDWLYRALHKAGFANQPTSRSRDDGLTLADAYITAVVRCAPPANKPTTEERDRCMRYLEREFHLMRNIRVVLVLGSFAWHGALQGMGRAGHHRRPKPAFGHGAETSVGPYILLGAYHPSQQNTFTGRLTEPMLDDVCRRAASLLDQP